jgi:hypothetical protein
MSKKPVQPSQADQAAMNGWIRRRLNRVSADTGVPQAPEQTTEQPTTAPVASAHAGAGMATPVPEPPMNMNDWIRGKAGR